MELVVIQLQLDVVDQNLQFFHGNLFLVAEDNLCKFLIGGSEVFFACFDQSCVNFDCIDLFVAECFKSHGSQHFTEVFGVDGIVGFFFFEILSERLDRGLHQGKVKHEFCVGYSSRIISIANFD